MVLEIWRDVVNLAKLHDARTHQCLPANLPTCLPPRLLVLLTRETQQSSFVLCRLSSAFVTIWNPRTPDRLLQQQQQQTCFITRCALQRRSCMASLVPAGTLESIPID
jgi:hypothetical protein